MASPVLESFCCFFQRHNRSQFSGGINSDVNYTYNIFCTVFSTVGLCGAIYQLWPKKARVPLRTHREIHLFLRQNYIITWLTIADLLAAFGILIRSVLWLSNAIRIEHTEPGNSTSVDDFPHIFCAVNAGWFQYFYICTYMWTFCYALDVYLYVSLARSLRWLYQILGWVVSVMLAAGGLMSLYYPSLLECARDSRHLLPHYLSSYIPILFVMILNPVLFFMTTKKVRESLLSLGRYTDQERETVRRVQKKFFLLTVVFYICWLPNIVNGVLLIFTKEIHPNVFLTLWLFMAVLNPLQALFNSLLYRKVGGPYCYTSRAVCEETEPRVVPDFSTSIEYNNDNSSLLSFNRG